MAPLTQNDLEQLGRLGITPQLVADAHIERVTDEQARQEYGLSGAGSLDGLLFPYLSTSEPGVFNYVRLRRDVVPLDQDGRPTGKYMAPAAEKAARRLYFPPGAKELLADKNTPILLCEAEKSALAITCWSQRVGFPVLAIALGGCYGWVGSREEKTNEKILHGDLGICRDRRVVVLFDSNSLTSANVQRARKELKVALEAIGAAVHILDLIPGDGINGPDDAVGIRGDQHLLDLFDTALVGQKVLADCEGFIARFMVMTPAQLAACVVWCAHTWGMEAAIYTPYLSVSSAEKQSAKSRLLECLSFLVRKPWNVSGASSAALYRKISQEMPCLLFDEMDASMKADKEMAESLRGVLNAGNRRGAKFSRCVGKGAEMSVQDFDCFCPKALAGLNGLPETLRDRSVPIRMVRKLPGQKTARLRPRLVQAEAEALRERLGNWVEAQIPRLKDSSPTMPETWSDRQQDGCELLCAIADAAGGPWPEKIRKSLSELFGGVDVGDDSLRSRVLADLRGIFAKFPAVEVFPSSRLIEELKRIETSPWGDLNNSKGLTVTGLSKLLKPFGVFPGEFQAKGERSRGYRRADILSVFERYLPPLAASATINPSTCGSTSVHAVETPISHPRSEFEVLGSKTAASASVNAAPPHVLKLNPREQGTVTTKPDLRSEFPPKPTRNYEYSDLFPTKAQPTNGHAETDAERQSAIESHETYLRETARYPLTPEVAAESERIRQLFLAEEKEWRASLPPDPESGNGSAVLETVEVTDLSQIHPGRKWDGKIRHAGDINLR